MSPDFQVIQLEIGSNELRALSARRRNQLVGCMHAHNELSVLNRVFLFSLNDVGEGELHDDAHMVQMWTLMQLLAGKLVETWKMVADRFLKSNPIDFILDSLNSDHGNSLSWLRSYFGDRSDRDSSLRTIRDKTAFHYDRLNLSEDMISISDRESRVYLATHPANICYYVGSALMFRTIFALVADNSLDTSSMNENERMSAGFNLAVKDITDANFHMHQVLYGLIKILLEQATGRPLEEVEQVRIPVVNAPRSTLIGLPMFIDVGDSQIQGTSEQD